MFIEQSSKAHFDTVFCVQILTRKDEDSILMNGERERLALVQMYLFYLAVISHPSRLKIESPPHFRTRLGGKTLPVKKQHILHSISKCNVWNAVLF